MYKRNINNLAKLLRKPTYITDRPNSFKSLTHLCLWGFTQIKMRLQWNHLNMWGPIFVDYGFFCFVLFFAYLINFVNGKTQRFSVRTK